MKEIWKEMWTVGRQQAIFHILDIFVYHRLNLDIKPTKKIGWRVLHHIKPPAKYERNLERNVDCRSLTSQSQSWGLTSCSTARVILGQVLSIATCGTRTHRGDSL